MDDASVKAAASAVLAAFESRGWMLATAESCTGGLIAGALTEIAGSSAVVERGFVTYTDRAKVDMLGVPEALLSEHGAVSEAVARAMAEGALARAPVQAAVAVTGIAGPGGATATKPVGLVHFGLAAAGAETRAERHVFQGDRAAVRRATVLRALALFEEAAAGP
jgi:nicotinamide-nucleotide amidase